MLFVVIMTAGGKNLHFGVEDAVDHTVSLRDFAAPTVRRLTFLRIGMAIAGLGALGQFIKESFRLSVGFYCGIVENMLSARTMKALLVACLSCRL